MSLPNVSGHVIATGYNCQLRAEINGNMTAIAFVTSFQATEDYQAQEATVLGVLGPVSIDPQGYNCSITIDTLLPAKGRIGSGTVTNKPTPGSQQYEGDEGKVAITDFFPTRQKYMEDGALQKIDSMDFYNNREKQVIASFTGVLITSLGVQVEGNAYVRSNVQMRALTRD
jgi:hypothetical protein